MLKSLGVRLLWMAVLAVALCQADGQAPARLVLAHYMVTNQDYLADTGSNQAPKVDAYEREMRQAQALGIDGFALNVGGWLQEPRYIRSVSEMFEAALRLQGRFHLVFSADFCCSNTLADAEDMMRRFAANPRYARVALRQDGRYVLTTFAGDRFGPEAWQQFKEDLETGRHPSAYVASEALFPARAAPGGRRVAVFVVPAFFWGGELPTREAVASGMAAWSSVLDGSLYWGIAGVPGSGGPLDQVPSSQAYASVVHGAGKLYMAPVALQFWAPNANRYYEYSGGAGMRALWLDAIERTHPQWVEILTWNDFVEGTYISPIDDPNRYPGAADVGAAGVPRGTLGFFHSHAAAGDLMRFYIRWFKSGRQPEITRDTVFWFYRTQPAGYDAGVPPVAHRYGPVADVIYLTANLTAPATLRVTLNGRTSTLEVAAGSHDVSVPFTAGDRPTFALVRGGNVVAAGEGLDRIEAKPAFNDFYYSTGKISGPERQGSGR